MPLKCACSLCRLVRLPLSWSYKKIWQTLVWSLKSAEPILIMRKLVLMLRFFDSSSQPPITERFCIPQTDRETHIRAYAYPLSLQHWERHHAGSRNGITSARLSFHATLQRKKSAFWKTLERRRSHLVAGPRDSRQSWRHLDEVGRSASRAPDNKPEQRDELEYLKYPVPLDLFRTEYLE
jgi:hypothetical protein